ncbi:MAG: hypothetical protein R3E77_13195 [Steroidobacteraceae bacterium]
MPRTGAFPVKRGTPHLRAADYLCRLETQGLPETAMHVDSKADTIELKLPQDLLAEVARSTLPRPHEDLRVNRFQVSLIDRLFALFSSRAKR